MNNKSKGEKLFILCTIIIASFAIVCLTGCSGSCFGCTIGCDKSEMGCVSGVGSDSDGCASSDSCKSTFSCIDFEAPFDDDSGKVLLLSCESQEDGCGGESSCYNGTYCGGCSSCGTCGIFWGNSEDYDVDESEIGCINGCVTCGDSEGFWSYILENIYYLTDLK